MYFGQDRFVGLDGPRICRKSSKVVLHIYVKYEKVLSAK